MNKYLLSPLLVSGLMLCAASAPEPGRSLEASEIVVSGRQAGTPVSCVSMRKIRDGKIQGDGAILFATGGRDLFYINRPQEGCPELNSQRALRTDTPETHLCRGDIVTVYKPRTHVEYGACRLGDFVPYRPR